MTKTLAARMLCSCLFFGAMAHVAAAGLSHFPDAMLHDGFEDPAAGPLNDADAARFLAQATFGATAADIATLRSLGYQGWLDQQFAAPVSTQVQYMNWVENLPNTPTGNNYVTDETRLQIWGINAVGTPDPSRLGYPNNAPTDQLRQRVAFALSEIFVVSNSNGTLAYEPWCLASYYDMLAGDAFGTYDKLLKDVTLHPAMGIFLSSIQNVKADPVANTHPDQNYAREVMQLFSIGLNQLNIDGTNQISAGAPIATYTQATVEGFAAVFTGWDWNQTGCGGAHPCCDDDFDNCGPGGYDDVLWQLPMQPVEAYHDNTSTKQLLKYDNVALTGGQLAPSDAQTELDAALANIFNHPNVGPFISKQLIQRLVTSNPTPAYVQRVAKIFNDDESPQHVRGNLQAVVQTILLDPEARSGQWRSPTVYGKLREPIIKITHLWRAMNAQSANGRNGSLSPYPPLEDWYGEAPLRAPTVFNFFTPYFQQTGEVVTLGLYSPEFQILTDTMAVATPNNLYHVVFCNYTASQDCYASDDDDTMQTDDASDASLAVSNPAQLVANYNRVFMSGQMSPFMQNALVTHLNAITSGNRGASEGIFRVQHALYLILNSPEYSIQK